MFRAFLVMAVALVLVLSVATGVQQWLGWPWLAVWTLAAVAWGATAGSAILALMRRGWIR